VVVGMIALLIALLTPAVGAARSMADTVKCASNLHAIGHAMQQYANDYRGTIPRGYDYGAAYQQGHVLWAEALSGYVNHPVEVADLSPARDKVMALEFRQIGVYQCPDFPNDEQGLDYVSNSWVNGGTDGPAIVVSAIRRPSEIIFLTEANATSPTNLFCYHDVWSPMHLPTGGPPHYLPLPASRLLNDARHRGQINLLFLDGHAATKMYKDVVPQDFDFPVLR
jgi:prepilin-type processing-associated H-X9-DG protein